MSVMMEGGAVSAAAVGLARLRPRRSRVRREPIDVERLAAELAEPKPRSEEEIIAALEAEVRRVNRARAAAVPAPAPPTAQPDVPTQPDVPAAPVQSGAGLPLEQVRAWLEQVKDDLRKVQARVEYLQFEQTRLQDQHHLVAELISSANPA